MIYPKTISEDEKSYIRGWHIFGWEGVYYIVDSENKTVGFDGIDSKRIALDFLNAYKELYNVNERVLNYSKIAERKK